MKNWIIIFGLISCILISCNSFDREKYIPSCEVDSEDLLEYPDNLLIPMGYGLMHDSIDNFIIFSDKSSIENPMGLCHEFRGAITDETINDIVLQLEADPNLEHIDITYSGGVLVHRYREFTTGFDCIKFYIKVNEDHYLTRELWAKAPVNFKDEQNCLILHCLLSKLDI